MKFHYSKSFHSFTYPCNTDIHKNKSKKNYKMKIVNSPYHLTAFHHNRNNHNNQHCQHYRYRPSTAPIQTGIRSSLSSSSSTTSYHNQPSPFPDSSIYQNQFSNNDDYLINDTNEDVKILCNILNEILYDLTLTYFCNDEDGEDNHHLINRSDNDITTTSSTTTTTTNIDDDEETNITCHLQSSSLSSPSSKIVSTDSNTNTATNNHHQHHLQSKLPNYNQILTKFKTKSTQLLQTSKNKLYHTTLESMHKKENETKNHIRYHYDDKLSICRVSNLLHNKHLSTKLMLERLEHNEEIKGMYMCKLQQVNDQLQHSKDVIRLQEKIVKECKCQIEELHKQLQIIQNEYQTYKLTMEEKYNQMKQEWNIKTKQEVWAHFKIMNLKRKLKKMEQLWNRYKGQYKKLITETKDLKEKLKVSHDIRNGMKKCFEKRVSIIRASSGNNNNSEYAFNQDIMFNYDQLEYTTLAARRRGTSNSNNRSCRRPTTIYRHKSSGVKQCQTDERHHIEMKHQAIETPPFMEDTIKDCNDQLVQLELKLESDTKKYELAQRQNEAYKRLVSGKNIAMMLASEYRDLLKKPNSMEAQLLFNFTMPKGVLVEQGPTCKGGGSSSSKSSKEIISNNEVKDSHPVSSVSIPSSNNTLIDFKGIIGQIRGE